MIFDDLAKPVAILQKKWYENELKVHPPPPNLLRTSNYHDSNGSDSFKQDCSNVKKKYTLKIKHSSKLRQLGNLFYQHVFFSPWVPWDSLTDLNILGNKFLMITLKQFWDLTDDRITWPTFELALLGYLRR